MSRRARASEVLAYLGVENAESLLELLRSEGLFERDELEPHEADELRVATSLVRELGVNPAGVQVALRLRRRLFVLQGRVQASLLEEVQEVELREED